MILTILLESIKYYDWIISSLESVISTKTESKELYDKISYMVNELLYLMSILSDFVTLLSSHLETLLSKLIL